MNFCFKKFGFGLHVDSVVVVNFLHVLRSVEVRFISVPNPFEQTLGLFCHNYSFVNPSWDVLRLGMFGMKWCVFVSKGGQGGVILFIESISILRRVVIRSYKICFHFLFVDFMIFTKGNSSTDLGSRGRLKVKVGVLRPVQQPGSRRWEM